jgi:hemerythrin-like domain-containing protein
MRPRAHDQKVMEKSEPEHDEMRAVIAELRRTDPKSPRHDELVFELMRDVVHHVADEETVLLPEAERSLSKDRLAELGAQMTKRRLELVTPKAGKIAANTAVGFSGSTAAIVVGVASALFAARAFSRKPA